MTKIRWRPSKTRLKIAAAGAVAGLLIGIPCLSLVNTMVVIARAERDIRSWIRPMQDAKRAEIAARLFPPEVATWVGSDERTRAWIAERNRRLAEAEAAIPHDRLAQQHTFVLNGDGRLQSQLTMPRQR